MTSAAVRADSQEPPAVGSCAKRVESIVLPPPAASEAVAGLGDCQGLRQQIDIDVGGAAAVGARCDDEANAVGAHIRERHRLEAVH